MRRRPQAGNLREVRDSGPAQYEPPPGTAWRDPRETQDLSRTVRLFYCVEEGRGSREGTGAITTGARGSTHTGCSTGAMGRGGITVYCGAVLEY